MTFPWQGHREEPKHTEDWLITYADMITLLLCFFVVIFTATVAQKTSAKKEPTPNKTATELYDPAKMAPPPTNDPRPDQQYPVKLPEIFPTDSQFHKIDITDFPDTVPRAEDASEAATDKNDMAKLHTLVADPDEMLPSAPLLPSVETKEPAVMLLPQTPVPAPLLSHLNVQNEVQVEQKSDRLTTLEIASGAFFDSGSATLSDTGKTILEKVAADMKSETYKDYQITVEGHTDDSPVRTLQFPSNWELSTARASAVVQYFLGQGIAPQKLRAAGYADTFPKAPNRDETGKPIPANQAQNRRVVIKLEKVERVE